MLPLRPVDDDEDDENSDEDAAEDDDVDVAPLLGLEGVPGARGVVVVAVGTGVVVGLGDLVTVTVTVLSKSSPSSTGVVVGFWVVLVVMGLVGTFLVLGVEVVVAAVVEVERPVPCDGPVEVEAVTGTALVDFEPDGVMLVEGEDVSEEVVAALVVDTLAVEDVEVVDCVVVLCVPAGGTRGPSFIELDMKPAAVVVVLVDDELVVKGRPVRAVEAVPVLLEVVVGRTPVLVVVPLKNCLCTSDLLLRGPASDGVASISGSSNVMRCIKIVAGC